MKRIQEWIDEPREGVFYGRRVELTSNRYDDATHYRFAVRDWDTHVQGFGCAPSLDMAWEMALADLNADAEFRRKCEEDCERDALERASSTERHPTDHGRDGRAAE